MIILWNSSRNYSNRICKRRSQWLSLTLKDHNSTLLLVLMFAGTINWCLWVIVEVCGNVSAVRQDLWEDPSWFKWFKMFAWKTWEVFSRASHLGYILNFPRLRWQLTPQACSGGPWAPDFTTTCSSAKGSSATPWRSYLLTSYEQDTVKLLWSSRFVRSTVGTSKSVFSKEFQTSHNCLQTIPNLNLLLFASLSSVSYSWPRGCIQSVQRRNLWDSGS